MPIDFQGGWMRFSGGGQAGPPSPPPPVKESVFYFDPSWLLRPDSADLNNAALYVHAVLAYSAYAQSTDQLRPMQAVLGANTVGILATATLAPQAVVWGWPQGSCYCVAGTTEWAQIVNYLAQGGQTPAPAGVAGNVLQPFAGSASVLYPLVSADYALTGPLANVILIGHSMGGAVAYLVGQLLQARNAWPVSRVVTFGLPRIGDRTYAAIGSPRLIRYLNDGDLIPSVPPEYFMGQLIGPLGPVGALVPTFYRHSKGTRVSVRADGSTSTAANDQSAADGTLDALWAALQLGQVPDAHKMARYVARARNRILALVSSGNPRSGGPSAFLPRLDNAFLDLKAALGDTTPLGPG